VDYRYKNSNQESQIKVPRQVAWARQEGVPIPEKKMRKEVSKRRGGEYPYLAAGGSKGETYRKSKGLIRRR